MSFAVTSLIVSNQFVIHGLICLLVCLRAQLSGLKNIILKNNFNIYLNDLMLDFSDNDGGICNYTDDNTLYASSTDITK